MRATPEGVAPAREYAACKQGEHEHTHYCGAQLLREPHFHGGRGGSKRCTLNGLVGVTTARRHSGKFNKIGVHA
jgi:hypothetical protein